MHGLPLAGRSTCTVVFEPDRFLFQGGGNEFSLEISKITEIEVLTLVEYHNQYVSDAGGAVAGAIEGGSIGAILGGGARLHTTSDSSYYMIFTYMDDKLKILKTIKFELGENSAIKAKVFKSLYDDQYKVNKGYKFDL